MLTGLVNTGQICAERNLIRCCEARVQSARLATRCETMRVMKHQKCGAHIDASCIVLH